MEKREGNGIEGDQLKTKLMLVEVGCQITTDCKLQKPIGCLWLMKLQYMYKIMLHWNIAFYGYKCSTFQDKGQKGAKKRDTTGMEVEVHDGALGVTPGQEKRKLMVSLYVWKHLFGEYGEDCHTYVNSYCCSSQEDAVTLRFQLAAEKAETDQLTLQVKQMELTVQQLETNLNISEVLYLDMIICIQFCNQYQFYLCCNYHLKWWTFQARVAELEGGITELKTALSDAENSRQGLHQKLNDVKRQRDTLDQKYLSLLAVNENLKTKVSQIDCMQDEITEVKHEASQWKAKLSSQGAELSKLREKVEALMRENEDLKGEVEAQKAEVSAVYYVPATKTNLCHYVL